MAEGAGELVALGLSAGALRGEEVATASGPVAAGDIAAGGDPGGANGPAVVAEVAVEAGAGGEGEAIEGEEGSGAGGGLSVAQLGRLRAVLVAANPEAVAELIGGADFEAILARVESARAAFARVREAAARGLAAGVPRGGGTRAFDPAAYAGLSPEGKIAMGIESSVVSRQPSVGAWR